MNTKTRTRPSFDVLEARVVLSVAGSLDPTFGAGRGFVTIPTGVQPSSNNLNGVTVGGLAVQPDGKVVVAGTITSIDGFVTQSVLERLNPDGTLDATFGQGGRATLSVPTAGPFAASTVVIQPDGKIIEVGSGDLSNPLKLVANSFLAIRLNADGSTDTTYGASGVASYSLTTAMQGVDVLNAVTSAALQPDGKLVLAGRATPASSSSNSEFAAVRLNANGTLDTTFGNAGTAVATITLNGYTQATAQGVVVQPDGRIVLAGTATTGTFFPGKPPIAIVYSDIALVRLDADGTPDTTFGGPTGTNGQVLLAPDPSNPAALGKAVANELIAQPDGKLLVVGTNLPPNSTATANLVARLDADGTVDATYGQGGRATPLLSGPAAALPDGSLVISGAVSQPGQPGGDTRSSYATTRLSAAGITDPAYGVNGLATYNFGAPSIAALPSAIAVQPDGKVVVAGTTVTSSALGQVTGTFAVARVLPTATSAPGVAPPPATPPASFDGSGRSDLAVYLPDLGAFAFRPTTSVQYAGDTIIPFGIPGAGNTIPAAADYSGSGVTQVGAYLPAFGAFAIRPLGNGPDQIIPFGIAGAGNTIPAPADFDGDGKVDIAAYLPGLGAYAYRPSTGGPDVLVGFGIAGAGQSVPAPADYDGDGKADLAVYLASYGVLAVRPSSGGPDRITLFGLPGVGRTVPTPGDFDGDGKVDVAAYFPSLGAYAYRPSRGGADVVVPFGQAGDGTIPVPGDYSGSGRAEVAVFDPNYGAFAYRPAGGGPDVIALFGSAGVGKSVPIAAPPGTYPAPATAAAVPGVQVAKAAAVPAGPLASVAPRRAALKPVAQADPSRASA